MTLRLALYSDQLTPDNHPMDERLLALIGVPRPRIGYIACEPDPQRTLFSWFEAHYATLGAQLDVYVDETTVDLPAAWHSLRDCDAIHLSGGNTFSFLAWLRRRGLLQTLHAHAVAGGVLIGVSAGAILMTPSVATASLCGDRRRRFGRRDEALGLVPFGFWPHYLPGEEHDGRVMPKGAAWPIHACPDGSGLIVQGERIERFGKVVVLDRAGTEAPAR